MACVPTLAAKPGLILFKPNKDREKAWKASQHLNISNSFCTSSLPIKIIVVL
jgi:hypothetical protein